MARMPELVLRVRMMHPGTWRRWLCVLARHRLRVIGETDRWCCYLCERCGRAVEIEWEAR